MTANSPNPLRLLYTLTTYPPSVGGAQIHQHHLAQSLSNCHVQVVTHWQRNRTDWLLGTTLNAPTASQNYEIDGIPVHCLDTGWGEKLKMLPYVLMYHVWMKQAVEKLSAIRLPQLDPFVSNVDLVHNVRIGREVLSYASLELARKHDLPFVLTPVHHPRWVGWRYRLYLDIYRQADGVFTLTDAEKRILIELGVAADKIYTIGHGPIVHEKSYPQNFREIYKVQGPMVLFLGQHYAYKGYRQLLAACEKVWQSCSNAEFVFIGPVVKSSEKAFEEYADPRIHRLGMVDLATKTDALAACDLLCVPSSQESFGGVYTEAWSFSKPVIGCNIPAVADVIADGVDGFLVEQTAEAIAARLLDLLENPDVAQRMGQTGYQKVQQKFSWPAIAKKVDEAYRKVLAE
ncbi:glycosyltransferase [Leptolyngbya sp. Heron Island J]|uniref:glycosyltransferase family 4 protein n=1 Tax=Leptolyngbya sp. Heron Island J TaxID=1385935 RepID=UPI0003B9D2C9|nr:glycosyltransferase family 4 protein [Leptolyngbya sp. Heron Island J]ESA38248.1 glycosyltransferase [Leptolyngbya sp. Heron Island J]